MNLLKKLPKNCADALGLRGGDEIIYCIPYDISDDGSFADGYIVVTNERLMTVCNGEKLLSIDIGELATLKYEPMVGCAVLTAEHNGSEYIVARASLRHAERCAEFAASVKRMLAGWAERSSGRGKEKYCEDCGTLLIGGVCPKCSKAHVRMKRFLSLCKPYIMRLMLISLLMVAVTVSRLFTQTVNKTLLDDYLKPVSGSFADALPLFIVMFVLMVTGLVCTVGKNVLSVRLGSKMSMDMRARLFNKLQTLSMSYINHRPTGELMHRITFDTNMVRNFMERCFGNMFSNLITMIGAVVYMAVIDWRLMIIVVAFAPAVLIMSRVFHRRIHRMFRAQGRKGDSIKSRLQDVISGIRVVKSFGCENREVKRFSELSDELAEINSRNEAFWAIFFPIITLVMGLGADFATFFGGIQVLGNTMTVGTLTQFTAYAAMFYGPMRWMAHMPRMIINMLNSIDRMYEILDEEPEITDSAAAAEHKIEGNVRFDSVTFGYDPGSPVLDSISFDVKQGEMIGIVGASGVGKSTLINLLMRLYDPDDGRILIDGVDIKNISTDCLHSQIGVVLQETFMFSGTIAANIRYARPDASMEEVIAAAKMANAHDFICCLPDGYDTYITERGGVSGGERQRIAIARAILANPRLLILDEATSALDTESEELVQQAIERLTHGRTTFAIAHRLSTLRHSTRIIVLDKHRVAEAGTHDQLMSKCGIYYGLVTAQSRLHRVKTENEE